VTDPIAEIIGDYSAFAAPQRDSLLARGIEIAPYALSHLAFRVPEWDQYVHVRTLLERHRSPTARTSGTSARSLIVPAEPLEVLDGKAVPLIELIPPVHQRDYKGGAGAPRRRGRGHVRCVRQNPQAGPDGTAIPGPEQHTRPRLYPVRRLHPREVLSTFTAGIRRAQRWSVRRRVPPCRGLGTSAPGDGNRPEPAAALTAAAEKFVLTSDMPRR